MKRVLISLAVLAVSGPAVAVPSVAAAQEQPIARLDRTTPIAAFGGRLLWSTLDHASGNWSLVTRAGGVTQVVPVPPRRVPFDADLGPGPDGAPVAVYSRCVRETTPGSGFAPPLYNRGRGCDLYLYDFAAGTERRLANASAPNASEFFPTIWRGTVAFARVYDDKPDLPYVYTRSLAATQPSTRRPGGPRNVCTRDRATGRLSCTPRDVSRPMSLELYGTRLAFTWTYAGRGEGLDTEIRLDTIGGGHALVARQTGGGLTQVAFGWPAFEAGRLFWAQACFGDPAGCPGRSGIFRWSITTRRTERADAPASVQSYDRDGGIDDVVVDNAPGTDCMGDPAVPGGTCTLEALTPSYR